MCSKPVQVFLSPSVLPWERSERGLFPLTTATYSPKFSFQDINADNNPISSPVVDLFLEESYWRDRLCLSWDFPALHGPLAISSLLKSTPVPRIKSTSLDTGFKYRSPQISKLDSGNGQAVQALLKVETGAGSGEGLVRLVEEAAMWKSFSFFTFLKELRAQDARHSGLAVAARLKMLGIRSLIVEREDRTGDNWRSRYHQLVLHDCLGDWFKSYVKLLELNARTKTTRSTLGDVIADKVQDVRAFDKQADQEDIEVQQTQRFWFMRGNLVLCKG
ncbi:unnamed protein product [Diplocarpon coronariae]